MIIYIKITKKGLDPQLNRLKVKERRLKSIVKQRKNQPESDLIGGKSVFPLSPLLSSPCHAPSCGNGKVNCTRECENIPQAVEHHRSKEIVG